MSDLAAPVISDTVRECLPSSAIGGDTETDQFGRAYMAPTIVCLQYGLPDGSHEVVTTKKRVRDAIAWQFDPKQFDQIWYHNGPYDVAAMLHTFPELADLIWQALMDGRLFDTMYLQRMIQIARGDIGGPLALDLVTAQYGLKPPTKSIEAEYMGALYDVRTSFGLFHDAEVLPPAWHDYADYDGEIMLPLAARQVKRACIAAPGQRYPMVRLEDLAFVVRGYFGLHLSRVYGLRVNPDTVADLAIAARAALGRLQEAAQINGFLKPARPDKKKGTTASPTSRFCPVRWESRPTEPGKKQDAWDRRAERHAACSGCRYQAIDPVTGELAWSKDTRALKAAVTRAYEGRPPLTEKKKDKKTGKMKGGGQIATARHVLQDSGNEELESWSQYNEFGALMSKDMKIFAQGVVHTNWSVTNNLRPISSGPNILNFRRNSFYFGTCPNPECGFEMTLDPGAIKKGKAIPCPACEMENEPE